MTRITIIALLCSFAIRAAFVLIMLGFSYWGAPANMARFIGAQVGASLLPAALAVIIAAFFYFPKKNQWWEKRGIMPAVVTVGIFHLLAIIGDVSKIL